MFKRKGRHIMKKEIYLAGGCFWGTEQYLENVQGVLATEVGYANGNTQNPTYEQVCRENTGHAEAVKVDYDNQVVGLSFLLDLYYDVINPVSINKQGGDIGKQYRTGIYFTDPQDRSEIEKSIANLQAKHEKPIAIEVLPLENYYKAEEYHQKYLTKNPDGYCHISIEKVEQVKEAVDTSLGK